ncbi:Macrophage colony-stimulating factor 1 receptor [Paramarasmius palmivorus]|uniref:Macrophage colony-stimulating factor 1 receptor n=1 Tax=Paramarasmius palmivorus TaxID=297713 RepID=A0AAW0DQL3_9AGAR
MVKTLLLVACVLIDIAILVYFFYWNRFVAWILGTIIRLVYWNEGASSLWLEIGAIQFSVLSGRILLKDVRYHTSNQTVKIVKVQISWRYWIRRPMMEEDMGIPVGENEHSASRDPACRIQITLHGLEWFLYNRTSAFDAIISQLRSNPTAHHDNTRERNVLRKSATSLSLAPSFLAGSLRSHTPQVIQRFAGWVRQQLPNLDPKELLPLGIEINKGAIICGNASTPSLMVADFQRATGTFGVMRSRSKYDLYKQMLSLSFRHAVVRMNENYNYHESMVSTGEVIDGYIDRSVEIASSERLKTHPGSRAKRSTFQTATYHAFNKVWNRLKLYRLVRDYLNPKKNTHTKKREKSRNDDTPIGIDFSVLEYAIERKILEAPMLELSYYVDVAGTVPPHPHVGIDDYGIGNGDMGPEWGVDIVVIGGTLRYGPWADRQRAELQRAFFPPTYQNLDPTTRLEPGDQRLWTALKVFIEFRDQVDLHIPFREASKNWQWDGLSEVMHRPRKREPAYLHLTAGDRSSVSYLMPMVAGKDGYEPILEVHLDTVTVTSSLNDIRLVSAESCRVHCELPSPLSWNAERKDWTSGPPSHYYRFVPMIYLFEFDMHHYELNLYANDQNIIDKPLMREENAIFTFKGNRLKSHTKIPSNVFRPNSTIISFTVDIPDVSLNLSLPRWNTNALHAPAEGSSLAKVASLVIDGSYLYYADVREDNVEQLKLNLMANTVVFKALGWSIRYFMILRDNLFGSFTHFSTLYEYLERRERGLTPGDPVQQKYREGKANMMQVEMSVNLLNGMTVLPAGLPGYEISHTNSESTTIGHCIVLTFPELQVQLRTHDHYMEMTLNIDTISGNIEPDFPEKVAFLPRRKSTFVLDGTDVPSGVDITANRLFGPPPRNLTYVCIWEIFLGRLNACLSASDAFILAAAGNAFRVNFADVLNAPAADYTPALLPDLTFLKVALTSCNVVWKSGNAALQVSVPLGFTLDNNDLGGHDYRKFTSVKVPQLSVTAFLSQTGSPMWLEAGNLTTDFNLDIYSLPHGWQKSAEMQAEFIEEQDKETGRAKRMFDLLRESKDKSQGTIEMFEPMQTANITSLGDPTHKTGVYLPQPSISGLDRYYRRRRRQTKLSVETSSFEDVIAEQSSESDPDITHSKRLSSEDHLASTYFSHRPTVRNNEEDMNSGEESDDEDLTERSDSDSDWEHSDDSQSSASTPSPRRHYFLMGHNIVGRGWDPMLWDEEGPFHCTRDSKLPPPARPKHPVQSNNTLPPRHTVRGTEEHDTTYFRVTQRRAAEVTLTPLIIDVLVLLEDDAGNTDLSPELTIDDAMTKFISQISEQMEQEQPKCTILDVELESISIRVLLHLARENNGLGPSTSILPGKFSLLETQLQGISVSGGTSEGRAISVAVEVTRFQLSPLSYAKHKVEIAPCVLSSSLGSVTISHSDFCDGLNIASVLLQFSDAAPEALVLTGLVALDCVEQMKALGKKRNRHVAAVRSILPILQHSTAGDLLVDRLSTIQPSFLVQVGLPHRLRIDLSFRFLFHLRDCLFHLRSRNVAFGTVQGIEGDTGKQALREAIKARLNALEPDERNLLDLGKLASLFSLGDDPEVWRVQVSEPTHPSKYLSINVSQLRFAAVDKTSTTPSELLLEDVVATIRIRTFDLVDLTRPNSVSQTSLRHKGTRLGQRASVSLCMGKIHLTVFPHLMNIAQESLRVERLYRGLVPRRERDHETDDRIDSIQIDFICYLRDMLVQAVAETLIFEFGFAQLRAGSMGLTRDGHVQGMNHSVQLGCIFLRARSPRSPQHSGQDELASLVSSDLRLSVIMQKQTLGLDARVVMGVGGLRFTVPRSALRLYRFFEEWRADFLPGIESTMHAMLSEVEKSPSEPTPAQNPPGSSQMKIQLHVGVNSAGVFLRVMRNTWISWEVSDTIVHWNTPNASLAGASQTVGVQISSQMFCIVSRSPDTHAETVMKLKLPSIFLSGQTESRRLDAIALMQYVEFKIKPSHWDTLLGVQQKFGQDFNDLLALVHESRIKQPKPSQDRKQAPMQQAQHFSIFLQMEGFRVGFEGLSSVLYLECPGIRGRFDTLPHQMWSVDVSDLALSLAPRTAMGPRTTTFDRKRRSAFVVIDFKVTGSTRDEAKGDLTKNLKMSVTKIHAVMQPSSIGEIGDFVDEIQREMLVRQEQRAHELAAFKEKAQSILKTLEVNAEQQEQKKLISWLHQYVIEFNIRNVGVAFPLAHDHVMTLAPEKNRPLRAFLFSIKSVKFGTHRGETGHATMHNFSFQFISSFKQSDPSSFSGETHESHNRLVYPEMKAHVRLSGSAVSRQIYIKAIVSGFILELDSTIPEYVFSLFDVYREGKERVTKLSANLPQTSAAPEVSERKQGELPRSNIYASLTFLSGKVRMYSTAATTSSRARAPSGGWETADSQILDMGAEIFNLPIVSVWAEYRGTPPTQPALSAHGLEPSVLMFKSTVHSSHNVLRPTLLPFLTELMSRVENRMRTVHPLPLSSSISSEKAAPLPGAEEPSSQSRSSLQISFGLRIDKSKLELTCHPDVNVVAGLTWESGGFVVNASPDSHKVTFTGSVGGLSIGLKHGFLSEDCVRLDARNLAFSVSFAKTEVDRIAISSVSFVLETEFFGGVRFSRLQDMLCFKAVWLDRIPMFNNSALELDSAPSEPRSRTITGSTTTATSTAPPPNQEFVTAILVRIRQINLDIDLGQSISAVNFNLSNTVLRTKLTERSNEVSFSVRDLKLLGKGNLSGEAVVSNFVFHTLRRTHNRSAATETRMLELRMTSGPLVIMLESDYQRLLHYRAEPLAVEILDDWSMTQPQAQEKDRPLSLSFTVSSPEVVAVATVGTIPKLMSYANKFQANLEAQREGASRESKTFRISRSPRPDNPLSAVAEAMIHSARARFKEAEPTLSYAIKQHMSLRLELLRLVVFPRNMNDAEVAQFIGRDVRGHLSRLVESEATSAQRDIRLSFSTMKISRFTHLGHTMVAPGPLGDGKEWLDALMKDAQGADIVGLPSINMHMKSKETQKGGKTVLAYDFDSQFIRGQGMIHDEDIYITLNVGLYSWLTVLRKSLTREMEQVKATAEWRSIPSIAASVQKKPVDSVNLSPTKSASLPPGNIPSNSSATQEPVADPSKPASSTTNADASETSTSAGNALVYQPGERHIERLTMRQLGDATPDVMHPFFMKKAGFSLEDSLPQYVHEYATAPLEEIMEALLKLYSKQLLARGEMDSA